MIADPVLKIRLGFNGGNLATSALADDGTDDGSGDGEDIGAGNDADDGAADIADNGTGDGTLVCAAGGVAEGSRGGRRQWRQRRSR